MPELLNFLMEMCEVRYGVIAAAESDDGSLVFRLVKKPLRQHISLGQRVVNMHNMVRSMSRYVTKFVV